MSNSPHKSQICEYGRAEQFAWDEKPEQDIADGKLETSAKGAITNFES